MYRAALTGVMVLLVGLASAGGAEAGGGGRPEHSITVLGPNSSDTLTTFTTATCGKQKDGAFRARATSVDKQWRLLLAVPHFHGYDQTYTIPFGTFSLDDPAVLIKPSHADTPVYASWHHPSVPVPGMGEVAFQKKGKLLGVGFGPAMYDENGESAISFTGVVTCHVKKKHR